MTRDVDLIENVEKNFSRHGFDMPHEWIVVRMVFPFLIVLDGIQSIPNQLLGSNLWDEFHRGTLLFSLDSLT